jgi:hypothetical protein
MVLARYATASVVLSIVGIGDDAPFGLVWLPS